MSIINLMPRNDTFYHKTFKNIPGCVILIPGASQSIQYTLMFSDHPLTLWFVYLQTVAFCSSYPTYAEFCVYLPLFFAFTVYHKCNDLLLLIFEHA